MVAGGDQQDKSLYNDLSSATVSTSAVFTLAAVAAHEQRHVAVVDIGGAFLNADMGKEVPVHMRLDKTMTGFMTTLDPSYNDFVDDKGGSHSQVGEGTIRVRGELGALVREPQSHHAQPRVQVE